MVRNRGGLVVRVHPDSVAQHLEIRPGDRIISVNGHILRDEIDFRFYACEEKILLDVRTREGEKRRFEIEKDADDLMGISFQSPIFDQIKTCNNHCTFCFISQLPKGMRKSLYLKDDDYRLSFLFGNFISLTNLSEEDWSRIGKQRLSPLRISVHTTDPRLREELMGNPQAALIMDDLQKLAEMDIKVHVQIVLLQGLNDGDRLYSTLRDLESMGENIASVGIVPAVYTRYRKRLPSPRASSSWAEETVDLIEEYSSKVLAKRGMRWVYAADEFYFLSGRPFPSFEYYDDFSQYENGIGIVSDFREGVKKAREKVEKLQMARGKGVKGPEKVLVITGTMAYNELKNAVSSYGLEDLVDVCEVSNVFFGDSVTCAGLLTGQDVLAEVLKLTRNGEKYAAILVPSVSINEGRFLDGLTLEDIEKVLGVRVTMVGPTFENIINVLLGEEGKAVCQEIS